MTSVPIVITPDDLQPGGGASGATLSVANWPASGSGAVAPLHVHHADDEAWYVIEGALRFRLADRDLVATAGTTVLVPAGVPHTFGNAGPEPSRYLIIMTTKLQQFIAKLHQTDPADHPALYREYDSELLE